MKNELILKLLEMLVSDNNQEKQTTQENKTASTSLLGEYVIIRTYSAGVWAGFLKEKVKNEVYLTDARRLYYWSNIEGISLSGISLNGLKKETSKICAPVPIVWLKAIEIIPCSKQAQESIINQPIYIK
jgi:hypothetical protein